MRRLTLLRHAKTETAHTGEEDWDRMLEPRGQKDAPEMARRLRERKLKPDLIVASPAVRALTTAQIFLRELHLPATKLQKDERLYLASPKELLQVIHELGGEIRHLMIVGHNPGLTEFAERVSAERKIDNMPTCAIYTLEFDLKNWAELQWDSGINVDFDYPKNSC
jgi:phosphohistidine phosphatase